MAQKIKLGGELTVETTEKILVDTDLVYDRHWQNTEVEGAAPGKTQTEINQIVKGILIDLLNIYDVEGLEVPVALYKWVPTSDTPTRPTVEPTDYINNENLEGWTKNATDRLRNCCLWMSLNVMVTDNGTSTWKYTNWSDPIMIGGDLGEAGNDAKEREWIYIGKSQETTFSGNTHPANITNGTAPNELNVRVSSSDKTLDDWVPEGWSDTAISIDSTNNKFVYASFRRYDAVNEVWLDFNDPILWSNWGVRGLDGDGVLYIYKLYSEELTLLLLLSEVPTKPAPNANGEFIPLGWSDDPLSPYPGMPYCYCSIIKSINGEYLDHFEKLALWSVWTSNGTSVLAQYSLGDENEPDEDNWVWNDYFTVGDIYMRTSSDGGTTWTPAMRIVGESGGEVNFEFALSAYESGGPQGYPVDILESDWKDSPGDLVGLNNTAVRAEKPYLWARITYPDNRVGYLLLTGGRGPAGQSSFTSTMFVRMNDTPTRPAANKGSYSDPSPSGCEAGRNSSGITVDWSDGIPNGDNILWETRRIFTSDGESPLLSLWSEPRRVEDTQYLDIEFAKAQPNDALPAEPTDNNRHKDNFPYGYEGLIWFDPDKDRNSGTNITRNFSEMVWRAERKRSNGEYVGEWVITRIKGEQGTPATITISDDGYWVINGVKLNVKAEGKDGTGVNIHGIVTSVADLTISNNKGYAHLKGTPSTDLEEAQNGYCYICEADRCLYMWLLESLEWKNLGEFKGEPGNNSYIHIAYCQASPLNVTTNVVSAIGFTVDNNGLDYDWWGFCVNNESVDPGYNWNTLSNAEKVAVVNSYSWKYMKGSAGVNSIRLDIDNEFEYVVTDAGNKTNKAHEVSTTVHLYDGASEVDISGSNLSSFAITNGPVISGSSAVAQYTTAASGKGKKLTWTFLNNKVISDSYNITIGYQYNNVTYVAIFTVKASKGGLIYKLIPSYSALPCVLQSNNTLANPPALGLTVLFLDNGTPHNISSFSNSGTVTYPETNGKTYYIRYTKGATANMPTSRTSGSAWVSNVLATSSDLNIYIALFDSDNVLLDVETVPIIKDGISGDGIKSITMKYAISAYNVDNNSNDSNTYPDDITTWSSSSPEVTTEKPYLWIQLTVKYNYKTTDTVLYYCAGKKGDRGVDGTGAEWVYVLTTENVRPTVTSEVSNNVNTPHPYLSNDYLPFARVTSGRIKGTIAANANTDVKCTDEPQGVDSIWRYEWEIMRSGTLNNWPAYSGEMVLHNNYSESPLIIDIDNDSDVFVINSETNKTVNTTQTKVTNVSMLYGTEELVFTETPTVTLYFNNNVSVSDTIATASVAKISGKNLYQITVSIKPNVSISTSYTNIKAKITGKCARGTKEIYFTIGKVANGTNGDTPVFYELEAIPNKFAFSRSLTNELTPSTISSTIKIYKIEGDAKTEVSGSSYKYGWKFDSDSDFGSTRYSSGTSITIDNENALEYGSVNVLLYINGTLYPESETLPIIRDGLNGNNGGTVEYRYQWSNSAQWIDDTNNNGTVITNWSTYDGDAWHAEPIAPSYTANGTGSPGNSWTTTITTRPGRGYYLWCISAVKNANGTYGDWGNIVLLTGIDGTPGQDVDNIEWIYSYTNDPEPSTITKGHIGGSGTGNISNKNLEDWVPNGWSDSPGGVDVNNKTEYASWRRITHATNGLTNNVPNKVTIFGDFSTPIIWSHYGERGIDGDGVEYIYARTETDEAPYVYSNATHDGKTSRQDDFLPRLSGASTTYATDEPQGVNGQYKYEWVMSRTKEPSSSDPNILVWKEYPVGSTAGKMTLWSRTPDSLYRILFTYNDTTRTLVNEIVALSDYSCTFGENDKLFCRLQYLSDNSWVDCSDYYPAIRSYNSSGTPIYGYNSTYKGTGTAFNSARLNDYNSRYFTIFFVTENPGQIERSVPTSLGGVPDMTDNIFMSATIFKVAAGLDALAANLDNDFDVIKINEEGKVSGKVLTEGLRNYVYKVTTTATLRGASSLLNFTTKIYDENNSEYTSGAAKNNVIVTFTSGSTSLNLISVYFLNGAEFSNGKKEFKIVLNNTYNLKFIVKGITSTICKLQPDLQYASFDINSSNELTPESRILHCGYQVEENGVLVNYEGTAANMNKLRTEYGLGIYIRTQSIVNDEYVWSEGKRFLDDANHLYQYTVPWNTTYPAVEFILTNYTDNPEDIEESEILDRETIPVIKSGQNGGYYTLSLSRNAVEIPISVESGERLTSGELSYTTSGRRTAYTNYAPTYTLDSGTGIKYYGFFTLVMTYEIAEDQLGYWNYPKLEYYNGSTYEEVTSTSYNQLRDNLYIVQRYSFNTTGYYEVGFREPSSNISEFNFNVSNGEFLIENYKFRYSCKNKKGTRLQKLPFNIIIKPADVLLVKQETLYALVLGKLTSDYVKNHDSNYEWSKILPETQEGYYIWEKQIINNYHNITLGSDVPYKKLKEVTTLYGLYSPLSGNLYISHQDITIDVNPKERILKNQAKTVYLNTTNSKKLKSIKVSSTLTVSCMEFWTGTKLTLGLTQTFTLYMDYITLTIKGIPRTYFDYLTYKFTITATDEDNFTYTTELRVRYNKTNKYDPINVVDLMKVADPQNNVVVGLNIDIGRDDGLTISLDGSPITSLYYNSDGICFPVTMVYVPNADTNSDYNYAFLYYDEVDASGTSSFSHIRKTSMIKIYDDYSNLVRSTVSLNLIN